MTQILDIESAFPRQTAVATTTSSSASRGLWILAGPLIIAATIVLAAAGGYFGADLLSGMVSWTEQQLAELVGNLQTLLRTMSY